MWSLVCMAAILGGTMRAPLTAIVFAFGLTHDVNAFLPTILGCAVAYGFTVIVMPRSILTEKIARRGRHVHREYGVDPLERHFVEELYYRGQDPLRDLLSGHLLAAPPPSGSCKVRNGNPNPGGRSNARSLGGLP